MMYSECCSEIVYDDYGICSKCLEHCSSYQDEDEEDDIMEKLLKINPEFQLKKIK